MPAAGTWRIDPCHSHVGFVTHHLLTPIRGKFAEFEGEIAIADDPFASVVNVSVVVSSLDVGNTKATKAALGETLLNSDDYPAMAFESTGITGTQQEGWTITGDLTLTGQTRVLELHAIFHGAVVHPYTQEATMSLSATGRFRRSDFGIDASFPIDDAPGVFVLGDQIDLVLEVEANRIEDAE